MKRSEFKSLVKECLVEILRDNMEIFTESSRPIHKQSKNIRNKNTKNKMKKSLMNLLEEEKIRIPPQMQNYPQRNHQQVAGGVNFQNLILSAADTMQQQNSMGEMSARSISPMYESQPQAMPEYAAYGNVPTNSGFDIPTMSGGADSDGESYWSKLAFFDR